MRVMVLVKATEDSEKGMLPDEKLLTDMLKYNEELVKAGIMLAGEGLRPSSSGKRVHFSGDKRTVVDGPFAEAKELVAGFWLWQVKSIEEAVEWVKRAAHTRQTACLPGSSARSPANSTTCSSTKGLIPISAGAAHAAHASSLHLV